MGNGVVPGSKGCVAGLYPDRKTALPDCPNVFLTATIPYKPLDSFAINTAIWMLVAKSEVDITDKKTRQPCLQIVHCKQHGK